MRYNDEARDFVLTATGDIFITRKLSPYTEPAYRELWQVLQSGDVRFTNLEMLIHEFVGHPVAESGGTYTQTDPTVISELQWAGFNLLARANNHSLDYSIEGLRRTSQLLDQAGFCHAGVGENLADARSARYLDLDQGRVGFLAACSTFASFGRAGEQRPDSVGRPGLNPVRYQTYYVVSPEQLAALRQISESVGNEARKRRAIQNGWGRPDKVGEVTIAGTRFVAGERPGTYTEVNQDDLQGNVKWISDAKRQSDFVVYSMHWHEGGSTPEQPATFHFDYAHACIDAGVDAFIGHGPHIMRGIEIYQGKPIFYSLGNFVFQNETVRKLPADVYEKTGLDHYATPADYYDRRSLGDQRGFPAQAKYWESVLPKCRYQGGELVECLLYPVTLGFGKRRTVRGRPMLAKGDLAEQILKQIIQLSAPFGTQISIENGIGVVRL
ncbi:MAG: CapA family protein [Bacillota bacterium]|jgi:poly-gamma-glutamate capsule biosynthesis protein CapA/YwtB (metallophosphatase superfamily)